MFAKFLTKKRTKTKMIGPELNNNWNENDLQNLN